jgi:hypothetical protein
LEYQWSSKYRISIHRSPLYQKMEALGMVGRELSLRVIKKPDKGEDGLSLEAAAGANGSFDLNIHFSIRHKIKRWGYGLWGMVEKHRINDRSIFLWGQTTSIWYQHRLIRTAAEFIAGVDAQRTDFAITIGEARSVYFYGSKFETGVKIPMRESVEMEPFVQYSLWVNDSIEPENNTMVFLFGLNFHFVEKVVLAFNYELFGEAEEGLDHQRRFSRRNYYVATKFYF